jgi:outer membrane cobalamin receptor
MERARRTIALIASLFALPLLAQSAVTDETEKKPTLTETVVVTATRSERRLNDLPVSVTVLSEKDIEEAPALVADDLLRTVPGVQMPFSTSANTFFGAETFSMRGVGGTRALVLLDGIPIHEPYYGTVLWQTVPLDMVRQIEVVRGANSSLFGNFAVGGTVHLLTHPVDRDDLRVDASYGTSATQRQSITVDHAFGENVGLRFGHYRFNTNGVLRIVTPGVVDVPAWNDSDLTTVRGDMQLSDRTNGFVKASIARTDLSAGTAGSSTDFESIDLATSLHHTVGTRGVFSATVFRKNETLGIVTTTVAANRATEFPSSLSDIPVNDTGASLEWLGSGTGKFALVSLGVDVRQTTADEERQALNRNGVLTQHDLVSGEQKFAGVFGQVSWRPSTRLEILASARVDHFVNRGENTIVGGATTDYPSATLTQLDPRVSFRFAMTNQSALRGAVYRAFKAPTLRDLYRNAQTPTANAIANPNLGPETLVGADLGFEWVTSRIRTEINLYRNDIDDLLTRVRISTTPATSQTQNVGTARSQGIEAMADVTLTRHWSLHAGYTYADAKILENAGDPTLEGKRIENVVPHFGTLGVRYRGDSGTSLGLRYRILSQAWGEAVNLAIVPAHRVLDVTASYPLRAGIELYFIGENVLDEQYVYIINTTNFRPAQTRTISGGLRLHLPMGRFGA